MRLLSYVFFIFFALTLGSCEEGGLFGDDPKPECNTILDTKRTSDNTFVIHHPTGKKVYRKGEMVTFTFMAGPDGCESRGEGFDVELYALNPWGEKIVLNPATGSKSLSFPNQPLGNGEDALQIEVEVTSDDIAKYCTQVSRQHDDWGECFAAN